MLCDFWSIGDLHGEKILGISVFSRKSGLINFGSCILDKLQPARHIATYPHSHIVIQPHSYIATQPHSHIATQLHSHKRFHKGGAAAGRLLCGYVAMWLCNWQYGYVAVAMWISSKISRFQKFNKIGTRMFQNFRIF